MLEERMIYNMECFIQSKTDLDFNFAEKSRLYYSSVRGVLKSIIINNVHVVYDKLLAETPDKCSSLTSKEDVFKYVLEDLPKEKFAVKKHFKQELKDIGDAQKYLEFVSGILYNKDFDAPTESQEMLKRVFGDFQDDDESKYENEHVSDFDDSNAANITIRFDR